MSIDWSKAPEGATRYHPETSKVIEHWLKLVGDEEWIWTSVGKRWMPHLAAVEDGQYYERPAPWSGEGLPPVGIVCEVKSGYGETPTFMPCEVIAHFDGETKPCAAYVYTQHDGTRLVGQGTEQAFRPVPTPEQIAAEEREKEVSEMVEQMRSARFAQESTSISPADMAWAYAWQLHSAGYRKVEGGAA